MSGGPSAKWELVREFGLEYSEDAGDHGELGIIRPAVADFLPGGGYLLVNERPMLAAPGWRRCRTLILSQTRTIVYDSAAQGTDDEYGCRMDERHIAILCRQRREIKVLSGEGACIQNITLPAISENEPRLLSWTRRRTFLVNFFSQGQPIEIAEFDLQGHVFRKISPPASAVSGPVSMQLLENGSILIANIAHHVVEELRQDGSLAVRWGKKGCPSREHGRLCNPMWARQLDNGSLLIADSYNHRCLAIDARGVATEICGKDQCLFVPSCITRGTHGGYLICDWGLRSICELNEAQQVIWREGGAYPRKRHLSFPRSVQYLGADRYLITDTGQNRIVEYGARHVKKIKISVNRGLAWPRSAMLTSRGTMIVADGLNSRVLEVTTKGHVLRELHSARYRGKTIVLRDPHEVRELPNGNLLVTDAAQNLVLESGWDGCVVWTIGGESDIELNDPHCARLIPDGRILISDTGHHRILFVNPETREAQSITNYAFDGKEFRLTYPRYSDYAGNGILAIADTFNNRVLAMEPGGSVRWMHSCVPDSPIPNLQQPRWVHLIDSDEVVISDHFNHRIVHMRRRAALV